MKYHQGEILIGHTFYKANSLRTYDLQSLRKSSHDLIYKKSYSQIDAILLDIS